MLIVHHVAFLEASDDKEVKGMQEWPLHLPINYDGSGIAGTLTRCQ